jgi:D-alanyl-lipoteichoic acid acyltransferase DltB (MBOAT superfamily)
VSFSSWHFLVFFPIVAALYYAVPGRWQWAYLLLASCVFYLAFVPGYILLIGAMIGVDFFVAIGMSSAGVSDRRRRLLLAISFVVNLGALAFFKYTNFLIANVNSLTGTTGGSALPYLQVIVPLGLSFHVFQALSYVLEVHRGNQPAERHFGYYALYMMFFPLKSLGPIERAQHLLRQCAASHAFAYDSVVDGLRQMAWGYFKKTVVADRLAVGADTVYADPTQFQGIQLLLATLFYTLQIYADFSGYADIAVGAAKVLGFDLVNNFRRPYFSASLPEFWRRWHISLYSWFYDYLFTPLAVSLRDWGKAGVVCAILLTFALSGLWHGAAWTFVVWGCLHGLGLSTVTLLRRRKSKQAQSTAGMQLAATLTTLSFVAFTFIFFRSRDLSQAWYVVTHLGSGLAQFARHASDPTELSRVAGSLGYYKEQFFIAVLAAVAMLVIEWLHARFDLRRVLHAAPTPLRWASYYAVVIAIVLYGAWNATQPFIYLQF